MNRKDRRLLARIPADLAAVLQHVSDGWRLVSYNPGGPGWSAEVIANGRTYRLSSEYMYISVQEIADGGFRSVMPPDDQRHSITPQQVAHLINEDVASVDPK